MQIWEFLWRNLDEVTTLTGEHLWMVGVSILAASLVGIPAGILITSRPRLERGVLGFSNLVQTVPSLALFGFLIPVPLVGGIGSRTAVAALILYALLPIIRSTHAGMRSIEPAVREAGRGMGMTPLQLLRVVELPLALPAIMAGLRVATVTSIGIATIAAAIGAGGLGVYIFRGVAGVNTTLILAGSLPAALLALLADAVLGWIEHRLSPAHLRISPVERWAA